MPLTSGANIGPYKIDRELGRGGMGVVFLAHDSRLGRAVALKALPDDVATDPDRLQRFEREARVLASLNHPNVAAIYGLEESDGRKYLALEHIDGETLADRLARGPLPLQETLDIAIQIASGMEAAHDAGVVHRDLKPANVMITPGDHAKVLDFGLAKGRVATDESGLAKSPALVDSPTMSSPTLPHSPTFMGTIPGLILGTAGYLSPEQARGKVVDRRTDIWSFGCVLYECLTGKLAFEGETVSDTIAKILERPMDWSALPKNTPPRLRELLERCLERDPKRRLRDIGDARITLEEIKSGRHADAVPPGGDAGRNRIVPLLAAALMGVALGGLGWNALTRDRGDGLGVTQLVLQLPRGTRFENGVMDDRTAAFVCRPVGASGAEQARGRLYVRRMEEPEFQAIPGSEGTNNVFLSPDGKTIEFWAPLSDQEQDLRRFRMPVDRSAPPVPVGDVAPNWGDGGVWLESGDIMVSSDFGTGYVRLPANGGPARVQTFVIPGIKGRFGLSGRALPRDRGLLLAGAWYEGNVFRQGIGVLDLKSGRSKIVLQDGGSPAYHDGKLFFTRLDALFEVPFDLGTLETKGEPVGLMNGLRQRRVSLHADFVITPGGTLAYAAGGNVIRSRHLVVADRQGNTTDWSSERRPYEYDLRSSPDGRRVTYQVNNANALTELWVSERGQSTSRRVRVRPGSDCIAHLWSADGRTIFFTQNANDSTDGIYAVDAEGATPPRRVVRKPGPTTILALGSCSPDSRTLLLTKADSTVEVWAVTVPATDGELGTLRPVLSPPGTHGAPAISRDGRVIAYQSNESGKVEVYVMVWSADRAVGNPVMVSHGGGELPRWSRDGRELYYYSQGKLMTVRVATQPALAVSPPTVGWNLAALRVPPNTVGSGLYDVLPDGRLVAVQASEEEQDVTQVNVALHFDQVVKQRIRSSK